MKDEGNPNAFSNLLGIKARQPSGVVPPAHSASWLPGIFVRRPTAGVPAEFPNPAQPSSEEASPFTVQEGGQPNGFTELTDPRPRHGIFQWLGGSRLLHTELLRGPAADPYTVTFRTEYLNWTVPRTGPSVVLVTTTSNSPIERAALDQPSTSIVVPASNSLIDYGNMHGWRLTTGLACGYLPPIELSTFSFRRNVTVFSEGSTDATGRFLARPVQLLDIPTNPPAPGIGIEDVQFVNVPLIPGVVGANGNISIVSRLTLWSLDTNFLFPLIDGDIFKLEGMVGYRHAGLYETLEITNSIGGAFGQPNFNGVLALPVGFSTTVFDQFRAQNTFDGGQIGLRSIFTTGRFSLFSDFKLALGNTRQTLSIDGSSTLTQPAAGRPQQTVAGGLLALKSNIGSTTENHFAIIPETNLSLSFQVTASFRLFGGYNVMYWNNVIRPGDHLNSVVDSRQIPTDQNFNPAINGIAPQSPSFVQRAFFARGLFVGIEFGF